MTINYERLSADLATCEEIIGRVRNTLPGEPHHDVLTHIKYGKEYENLESIRIHLRALVAQAEQWIFCAESAQAQIETFGPENQLVREAN